MESVLIFLKDDSVKVASYEVSKDYAYIKSEYCPEISLDECERNAEEIEGIGNTVREAAYDEERHTEDERKELTLTGEMYGSRHYEAAPNA